RQNRRVLRLALKTKLTGEEVRESRDRACSWRLGPFANAGAASVQMTAIRAGGAQPYRSACGPTSAVRTLRFSEVHALAHGCAKRRRRIGERGLAFKSA